MSANVRWLLFVLFLAERLGPHVLAADLTAGEGDEEAQDCEERSVVETTEVPVAPADESTIVGTWELTTTSWDDSHKGELIVNEDHSGTYDGPDGKLEISRLKSVGDKVSFRIMVPSPRDMFGDVRTELKGVVRGDTLQGEWVNYRGGGREEVTGKRIKTCSPHLHGNIEAKNKTVGQDVVDENRSDRPNR